MAIMFIHTEAVNCVLFFSNLECYSCEGISCQRSTLYTQTTDCEKSDTCVTLFENCKLQCCWPLDIYTQWLFTDTPTKKSCYAALSSIEKTKCDNTSNPLCYKCTGNRCNNLGRIDHKCLTCNTLTNPNCLQNPKSIQSTRCSAPISDDAYCFVKSVRFFIFLFHFEFSWIVNFIGRRFCYSRMP